ncbi:MAG: hypothetical protein CFH40_01977, partial [Alphaproteobacteria bacterium MarineAlpha10_Bin3]
AAIATPIRFRNKNLIYVPILHGANVLARWATPLEGVKPFLLNESENPEMNYRHIPVRGLYELRRAVDDLKGHLGDVSCPVTVLQGDEDPVVMPGSAERIIGALGSKNKELRWIAARRHGILREDIGDTQDIVISFINALDRDKPEIGKHAARLCR